MRHRRLPPPRLSRTRPRPGPRQRRTDVVQESGLVVLPPPPTQIRRLAPRTRRPEHPKTHPPSATRASACARTYMGKDERMTELLGLRTLIYPVTDLDAAKAWFTELVGFGPYFDEPFFVGFSVGGYELGLLPDGDP